MARLARLDGTGRNRCLSSISLWSGLALRDGRSITAPEQRGCHTRPRRVEGWLAAATEVAHKGPSLVSGDLNWFRGITERRGLVKPSVTAWSSHAGRVSRGPPVMPCPGGCV